MSAILILKLFLVPALIYAVTLAGRRWGPAVAGWLGARLSGFFAMFPVMSTVLVGFSHRHAGPSFAVALLRGMVFGYYAFAVFCLALSLLLPTQPLAVAFGAAFACALAVQLGVKRLLASPRPAIRTT